MGSGNRTQDLILLGKCFSGGPPPQPLSSLYTAIIRSTFHKLEGERRTAQVHSDTAMEMSKNDHGESSHGKGWAVIHGSMGLIWPKICSKKFCIWIIRVFFLLQLRVLNRAAFSAAERKECCGVSASWEPASSQHTIGHRQGHRNEVSLHTATGLGTVFSCIPKGLSSNLLD